MPPRARLALGFVLALTVLAQQSARAEERLAWSVDSYESDVPEERDTVILTYGVPETDAVAFQAVCGGPDGASPHAVFWYDTIDLAEGQDVLLSFSVGDLTEEVPAEVYGKDAEVGVSGLQAFFSPKAPIWQAMANGDALTYGIPGGEQQNACCRAAFRDMRFRADLRAGLRPACRLEHPARTHSFRSKAQPPAGNLLQNQTPP